MHQGAFEFVVETKKILAFEPKNIVEFGGRNLNGTVRNLFNGAKYTSIDLYDGIGVDFIGNALDYIPVDDTPIDLIICCEVFEHAPDWRELIAYAHKLLKSGGYFIITCATNPRAEHSGVDGEWHLKLHEYYKNVDPDEMIAQISAVGFASAWTEVREDRGDLYCVVRKP